MEHWFLLVNGFIALLSAFFIVFLVTLRSVLEIAHLFNFLPKKYERFFAAREERAVERVLARVGLLTAVPEIKELITYRDIDDTELLHNYKTVSIDLVNRHLRTGSYIIGKNLRLNSNYYVALREALVDVRLAEVAARAVAAFIKDEIRNRQGDPIVADMVVGHREGSPLLAALVARELRRPSALYGEARYVRQGQSATDEPVLEGIDLNPESSAILVDDSTTDGHMLIAMANELRRRRIQVKHVFVIFRRAEGKAAELLEKDGIQLHNILSLDGNFLQDIPTAPANSAASR